MRSVPSLPCRVAITVLLMAAAGCGSRSAVPASDEERSRRGALTVLEGRELESAVSTGATLAQILSTRVPSVREMRSNTGGMGSRCPVFVLRGNSSVQQITEPEYYVDTSRANDSCILLTLSPGELRSIEVYGSGSSPTGIVMRARTGGAIVFRTRVR